jgi:hypothetical protein
LIGVTWLWFDRDLLGLHFDAEPAGTSLRVAPEVTASASMLVAVLTMVLMAVVLMAMVPTSMVLMAMVPTSVVLMAMVPTSVVLTKVELAREAVAGRQSQQRRLGCIPARIRICGEVGVPSPRTRRTRH